MGLDDGLMLADLSPLWLARKPEALVTVCEAQLRVSLLDFTRITRRWLEIDEFVSATAGEETEGAHVSLRNLNYGFWI